MPCPRPQIVLCQKTTCSHIAVCLPETLIQASHTSLHSVLSSVSLPHYSSSIFKREYALLQLVCLEANLSRSLQWTASPCIFLFSLSFISQFISVFLSLLYPCDSPALEDMEGGGQEVFVTYVTEEVTEGWNTERHLESVTLRHEAGKGRGKTEPDKKVEDSNSFFF